MVKIGIFQNIKGMFTGKKGIVTVGVDNDETFYFGNTSYSSQNELLENIYSTIANEMSLLQARHYKKVTDNEGNSTYSEIDRNINYVLNVEANELMTSSEMLYTLFYQLIKYKNAIAIPIFSYTKDGQYLESIEVLDVSKYSFGYGYSSRNNVKYLLFADNCINTRLVNLNEYMPSTDEVFNEELIDGQYKVNGTYYKVNAIRYDSIIHLRGKPNKIFGGDNYEIDSLNNITKLFDANINAMLTTLSTTESKKGILYVKNSMQNGSKKEEKGKEFNAWFKKRTGGAFVLDVDEEFKPFSKDIAPISKEDLNNAIDMLYKTYGINNAILEGKFSDSEYNAFYNKTLEPLIRRFSQEINRKILSKDLIKKGEYIQLNKLALIGGSIQTLTNFIDKVIYHGLMTTNQVAEMLGLQVSPNGDKYYTNANAVEIMNAPKRGENSGNSGNN